jgi:hypothetical protein
MVAQHHLPSLTSPDQTLDSVWRSAARRVPARATASFFLLGIVAVATSVITGHLLALATLGVLANAFACYAVVVQPHGPGRRLAPATRRLVGAVANTIAVLAALATGLLILAALFGGSIEVMRR